MHTLLLSLLWENDDFRAFFTLRQTKNLNEYRWFTQDRDTGAREHWTYIVEENDIIIDFDGVLYRAKELIGMKKYNIAMIQWTEIEDDTCYVNWNGVEIPDIKSEPYIIYH